MESLLFWEKTGCPLCPWNKDFGAGTTKRNSRHDRNARNGDRQSKVHEQIAEPGQLFSTQNKTPILSSSAHP